MMLAKSAPSMQMVAGKARVAAPIRTVSRVQLRRTVVFSGPEVDLENPDSEIAKKKAEAERLRAAEKFMVVGKGSATCKGCGYEYTPEKGDPDFPVAKGTNFEQLPEDYVCPICGAPKSGFQSQLKVVAGFAENQKYGFGTNSMTGGQKQSLIYGALAIFFLLFIAGYGLE